MTSETFVIFDTEYTSWEGCNEKGWNKDEGEYKELVQIGAVKCSCVDFSIESTFSVISNPMINPVLSEYFVDLTGITNQEIQDKGVELPDALDKFAEFVNEDVCYSYGDDKGILEYNVEVHNLEDDFGVQQIESNDIRPIFKLFGVPTENYSSGTVCEHFDRKPDTGASQHNAVYDCLSLRLALKQAVEER